MNVESKVLEAIKSGAKTRKQISAQLGYKKESKGGGTLSRATNSLAAAGKIKRTVNPSGAHEYEPTAQAMLPTTQLMLPTPEPKTDKPKTDKPKTARPVSLFMKAVCEKILAHLMQGPATSVDVQKACDITSGTECKATRLLESSGKITVDRTRCPRVFDLAGEVFRPAIVVPASPQISQEAEQLREENKLLRAKLARLISRLKPDDLIDLI